MALMVTVFTIRRESSSPAVGLPGETEAYGV
jgi:hypothetical protein